MPIENYGYLKSKPNKPTASVEDYIKALDLLLNLAEASKEMERKAGKDNDSGPLKH